jgi:glutathione S-transferase
MKLYTFFRSSASYRVRIALNLKGLDYEQIPIHLRRGGGEQWSEAYKSINPQALVPALEDGGRIFTQSLAIACEIHPIQNLRVLLYLKKNLNRSDDEVNGWAQHWITLGLSALEQIRLSLPKPGAFCFGDAPTLADICLVPQLANARRFGVNLLPFPSILNVEQNCLSLPAFANAAPEKQPDAEP